MAGTVKLPVIGTVKTGWAVAGAGIVLGIVGFAYWRHRENSAAAAAASPASAGGSSTGSGIDPATGYPYGSAQDEAALAAQAGTSSESGIDPETGYPYGSVEDEEALASLEDESGAGGGYYDDVLPTTTGSATTANTGPGTFTDNAYWVAYCEQNVTGYTPSQIQGALAAAIAGIPLTTTQMSIYQACIAVGGSPPTAIKTPTVTTGGGGGTGGSSKPGGITGLKATPTKTGATLTWSPVTGATSYDYELNVPGKGGTTAATDTTIGGLTSGKSYTFRISAKNSAGTGPTSTVKFTTSK
jgi:large repetitive protein